MCVYVPICIICKFHGSLTHNLPHMLQARHQLLNTISVIGDSLFTSTCTSWCSTNSLHEEQNQDEKNINKGYKLVKLDYMTLWLSFVANHFQGTSDRSPSRTAAGTMTATHERVHWRANHFVGNMRGQAVKCVLIQTHHLNQTLPVCNCSLLPSSTTSPPLFCVLSRSNHIFPTPMRGWRNHANAKGWLPTHRFKATCRGSWI